ncbi:protein serine/threonine kinase, putative [Entamoeba invadens IP1]|uniref:Protein serine/threonine kinase, putative n=1 Tax=Entamoeba invadens IP1 TaxID=370355 RepID=A0A0A1U9C8_ENTIV|nr:protein serine/threonine kinase, putative [Entamoeba invadens IP1]ELP91447.1 protein serine/threonine kinase, putative [Entamoeba invadens IP1]|eukprot:XP_004258218.1 protein serine/threonine kinase, putative [Entamoeba invadens IP1]
MNTVFVAFVVIAVYGQIENCVDQKEIKCTLCNEGYYPAEDGSLCSQCEDTNCKTCTDLKVCTLCKEPFYKNCTDFTCVTSCTANIGYYKKSESNECERCSESSCTICENDLCSKCENYLKEDTLTCTDCSGVGVYKTTNGEIPVCKECSSNCLHCLDNTKCFHCNSENYLNMESYQCQDGCSASGFYDSTITSSTNKTCSKCSIKSCAICVNDQCTSCESTLFLKVEDDITECVENCGSGYYSTVEEGISKCLPCSDTNCETCPTNGVCTHCKSPLLLNVTDKKCETVCKDYYYSTNFECQECSVKYCTTCPSDVCSVCDSTHPFLNTTSSPPSNCIVECPTEGYYQLESNKCKKCNDGHCNDCTDNNGVCRKCMTGYFLDGTECKLCSTEIFGSPCATCSQTTKRCEVCMEGYYPDANGQCKPCADINCMSNKCDTKTEQCSQCVSGYYLNTMGACATCKSINCLNSSCSQIDNTCTECINNNFLDGSTCKPCNEIINGNCLTCSSTSNKCTKCDIGYYPKNNFCQSCSSIHCQDDNCNQENGKCLKCVSGFYLDKLSSTCQLCSTIHCENDSCSSVDNICSKCVLGYYPLNGICQTCSSLKCENSSCDQSNGKCKQCEAEYYLEESTNRCHTCESMNCSVDSCFRDNSKCTNCTKNNFLNETKCFPCENIKNGYCKTCNPVGANCLECQANHFLHNTTRLCHICSDIPNCNQCSQTLERCTTCKNDSYSLDNSGHCVECSLMNPNCELCNPKSYGTCYLCKEGYYLDNNKCVKCKDNCAGCSSATNCFGCVSDSFVLFGNECKTKKCDNTTDMNDVTCSYHCNNFTSVKPNCDLSVEDSLKGSCLYHTEYKTEDKIETKCIQCPIGQKLFNNVCTIIMDVDCAADSEICTSNITSGVFQTSNRVVKTCESVTTNAGECVYSGNTIVVTGCIKDYKLQPNGNDFECVFEIERCEKYQHNNKQMTVDANSSTLECVKCHDGYYLDKGICSQCPSECPTCYNNTACMLCNNASHYVVYNDGKLMCVIKESCYDYNELNRTCIECGSGYYKASNGECKRNTIERCLKQTELTCLECEDNAFLRNGKCYSCSSPLDEICFSDFIVESPQSNTFKTLFIKQESASDTCEAYSKNGCVRCVVQHYLNGDGFCSKCSENCTRCLNSETCVECEEGFKVSDNVCVKQNNANCDFFSDIKGGCVICSSGYYLEDKECQKCQNEGCTCIQASVCTGCIANYYMPNTLSICKPFEELTNCIIKTDRGCTLCNESYYLSDGECDLCSSACKTCKSSAEECTQCSQEYVKKSISTRFSCVHYTEVPKCLGAQEGLCSSCESGYKLSVDEISCEEKSYLGAILGSTLSVLFVIIVVVIILLIVFFWFVEKKLQKHRLTTVTLFKIKYSNLTFVPLSDTSPLEVNKPELRFDLDASMVPVGKESRDLICIGNISKYEMKVQFTVKESKEKYSLRYNPELVALEGGYACEIELFITPHCTCTIEDTISVVSFNMKTGEEIVDQINLKVTTEITTQLDPDELIDEKKLGEGSFGIVYKGKYRGHSVAIKKMRGSAVTEDQLKEFEKEVAMLDKFRCEYIVHFYGAVTIPNKVCMVTEYAEYGSLQDLIKKRMKDPIDKNMRIKILLDASKGVKYLHDNDMLHRDVKPDNILVFSLDKHVMVSGKLTDFGSSRNVNLMMTNMTFTKGIGTPSYMAPEVLNREYYKQPADVYSLGMTIYTTMLWKEPFPKILFPYAWSVADFVTSGQMLGREGIDEDVYAIIVACWTKSPKERMLTNVLVKKLGDLIDRVNFKTIKKVVGTNNEMRQTLFNKKIGGLRDKTAEETNTKEDIDTQQKEQINVKNSLQSTDCVELPLVETQMENTPAFKKSSIGKKLLCDGSMESIPKHAQEALESTSEGSLSSFE